MKKLFARNQFISHVENEKEAKKVKDKYDFSPQKSHNDGVCLCECVIVVQPAGFKLGPCWCYVCLFVVASFFLLDPLFNKSTSALE